MSTNFLLILQVCSFLTGECAPAIQVTQIYSSWYDCVAAAQLNGLKLLQQSGAENVNNYQLAIKYGCYPTQDL
jgi:hypothetical protein